MIRKTIIISDVHACANELLAIIKYFPDSNYICVGDLFDRGEGGVDIWDLFKTHNVQSCMGNHERKLLQFFNGEKNYLPSHYYHFLNLFFDKYGKNGIVKLINFIEKMPLIIPLDQNSLVCHAGPVLCDPFKEEVDSNIYGRYENEEVDWWEKYRGECKIYCGHVARPDILFKNNMVGLDTAACHGNMLSSICHETGEIFQVRTKNYYQKIKGLKVELNVKVLNCREKIINYEN